MCRRVRACSSVKYPAPPPQKLDLLDLLMKGGIYEGSLEFREVKWMAAAFSSSFVSSLFSPFPRPYDQRSLFPNQEVEYASILP